MNGELLEIMLTRADGIHVVYSHNDERTYYMNDNDLTHERMHGAEVVDNNAFEIEDNNYE